MDTGKYVYGIEETIKLLETGSIQTLIVWETLPHIRFSILHTKNILIYTPEQVKENQKKFMDPQNEQKLEFESCTLLEWLVNNYDKFGCKLEFISNKTQEGDQFVKGFGGVGGILRYKVNLNNEFDDYKQEDDENNEKDEAVKKEQLEVDLSEFV